MLGVRDFIDADAEAIDRVALAAFQEFQAAYSDWPAMSATVSKMSTLATYGEIVVAERDGAVVGAVTYVAPYRTKPPFFDPMWPIIRMLVVDPAHRGRGVGRALMDECVERARRDGSPVLALHTSPIMTAALTMYGKMRFERLRDAPSIFGVPSAVYLLRLEG
jgi:ribosomal protein S18 acetylase RimI-like enzyme